MCSAPLQRPHWPTYCQSPQGDGRSHPCCPHQSSSVRGRPGTPGSLNHNPPFSLGRDSKENRVGESSVSSTNSPDVVERPEDPDGIQGDSPTGVSQHYVELGRDPQAMPAWAPSKISWQRSPQKVSALSGNSLTELPGCVSSLSTASSKVLL